MSYSKFVTNIMTRKGQSSRWDRRAFVKECAKKARRQEAKKEIRDGRGPQKPPDPKYHHYDRNDGSPVN
jgi:hypothetical protein